MLGMFLIFAIGGVAFQAMDNMAGDFITESIAQVVGSFIALFVIPGLIICIFKPDWSSELVFSMACFSIMIFFYVFLAIIREKESLGWTITATTVVALLTMLFAFVQYKMLSAILNSGWMWYDNYNLGRTDVIFREFKVPYGTTDVDKVPNQTELVMTLVNDNFILGLLFGLIGGVVMFVVSCSKKV